VKVNFSNAQSLALLHLTRPTNKTIKNRANRYPEDKCRRKKPSSARVS
jgi:hypothetical protein